MSRISQLILARGDAQARGQSDSGAIWGQAIQNLGQTFAQVPGQIQQGRQAEQAQQQEAQRRQLWSGGQMPTPDAIMSAYGPEDGLKLIAGLKALQPTPDDYAKSQEILRDVLLGMNALEEETRATAYPQVRQNLVQRGIIKETDAPEQYSPEFWKQATGYGQEPPKPEAKKTREVQVRNPDGSITTQIVEDAPGQSFTSAAPVKEPPQLGSEARALYDLEKQLGQPLTEAQVNAARRRHAAATRFVEPKADTAPAQDWVVRDGKPTPIQRGTAQPGDIPYNAGTERQDAAADKRGEASRVVVADAIQAVRDLRSSPGKGGAVGAGIQKALMPWRDEPLPGTEAATYRARAERLKSLLTLPELEKLRGLGAMSDREFKTLSAAAAALDYGMEEAAWDQELDRIEQALNEVSKRLSGAASGPAPATGAGARRVEPTNDPRVRRVVRP